MLFIESVENVGLLKPFDIKNRQLEKQRHVLNMLAQLLNPVTEGYDHVNLDMSFSFLGDQELYRAEALSMKINIAHIWELKLTEFLLRGELATVVISRRSRGGKSMNLATEVMIKQEQTYKDETQEKKGFNFGFFGGKKREGGGE